MSSIIHKTRVIAFVEGANKHVYNQNEGRYVNSINHIAMNNEYIEAFMLLCGCDLSVDVVGLRYGPNFVLQSDIRWL